MDFAAHRKRFACVATHAKRMRCAHPPPPPRTLYAFCTRVRAYKTRAKCAGRAAARPGARLCTRPRTQAPPARVSSRRGKVCARFVHAYACTKRHRAPLAAPGCALGRPRARPRAHPGAPWRAQGRARARQGAPLSAPGRVRVRPWTCQGAPRCAQGRASARQGAPLGAPGRARALVTLTGCS